MLKFRAAILKRTRAFLRLFDIGIARFEQVEELLKNPRARKDLQLLIGLPPEDTGKLIRLLEKSKSQLRQDLVVLSYLKFKKNGFFVEFGAADGINLSNTYLLESEFSWTGILTEPAKAWQPALELNRNCFIDSRCVLAESNQIVRFVEHEFRECSAVEHDSSKGTKFRSTHIYEVKSVSLNDLLETYSSPTIIDFLSIDTEGTEYEILSSVDLDKYTFRFISCEHNFSKNREKIYLLLSSKGYKRVLTDYSEFDDWYVYDSSAKE